MKKALFIFLFLTLWLGGSAQTANLSTQGAVLDTAAAQEFFTQNNFVLDSNTNMQLYYEVYRWVGTPYYYSGEGKRGIDCSGFANKIYETVYGKTLLGGSRDIYKTVTPGPISDACEGDLLFFKIKNGRISHVAVYLQNGKFAHASTSSGVIVSDLSEAYYTKYFYQIGKLDF